MNLQEFIQKKIDAGDVGLLCEASGPDAWVDYQIIAKEVATAIMRDDAEGLLLAMRDPFMAYMQIAGEREGCISPHGPTKGRPDE